MTTPSEQQFVARTPEDVKRASNWVGMALNIAWGASRGQEVKDQQRSQNICRLADREWTEARKARDTPFQIVQLDSGHWMWCCSVCDAESCIDWRRSNVRRGLLSHMRQHILVEYDR